jgi:hypothetical protein
MTNIYVLPGTNRFPLGELYVTAAVDETLSPEDIAVALERHARGDWGDVCDEDRAENDLSFYEGSRLLSVYHDRNGVKFWIITEADRSVTTVLLPDDY